ncbi:MAG: Amuc_1100 family pilus-like protein [bacterium]
MKSRSMVLTLLIVISGLLLGLACAMLFLEKHRLKAVEQNIDIFSQRLTSSMALDPYPNQANIDATRANVKTLEADVATLRKEMNAGQIAIETNMVSLEWRSLWIAKKEALHEAAKKAGVVVPPACSFGFEKYDDGTSPLNRGDVRRLELQLKTIDQLCRLLYQSGISELKSVARELFEEQTVGSSSRRAVTAIEQATTNETPLYAKEHFRIELMARESAVVEILNRLSINKMFTVVTSVGIDGHAGVELRSTAGTGEELERETRQVQPAAATDGRKIITGRGREQPAEVVLELDVYEFGEVPKESSP